MKKFLCCLLILILIFLFVPFFASAVSYEELYEETVESFKNAVPSSIEAENSLITFTERIKSLLNEAKDYLSLEIKAVISSSAAVVVIILLAAVASCFTEAEGARAAVELSGSLAVFLSVYSLVSRFIGQAADTIEGLSSFAGAYIPAFAGTAAACGQVTAAAWYSGAMITAVSIMSAVIASFITPLVSVYLSLSLASSLTRAVNLSGMLTTLSKLIKWILTAVCVIFSLVVSIQTVVETSADKTSVNIGRLIVGNYVPVVGGRMADSVAAVLGSMKAVKGSVGGVGIASLIALALPITVRYVVFTVMCFILGGAARLFSLDSCARLIDGVRQGADVLYAGVCVVFAMLVFSTALLLGTGG